MAAFGIVSDKAERPDGGAKLPLRTTQSWARPFRINWTSLPLVVDFHIHALDTHTQPEHKISAILQKSAEVCGCG